MKVLVDDPVKADFERHFAPWPLRLYLITPQGSMAHIAAPQDCSFSLADFRQVLMRHQEE